MSKRRISKGAISAIGEERISKLRVLSEDALRNGRGDLAKRYVELARSIGMKTRVKIPKDFTYCKDCHIPMIPGVNSTVRLTGGKIVTRCQDCGSIKRMPYNKERSK